MSPEDQETISWANQHQYVIGLLYDLNLLPEQLEEGTDRWQKMIEVIQHQQMLASVKWE